MRWSLSVFVQYGFGDNWAYDIVNYYLKSQWSLDPSVFIFTGSLLNQSSVDWFPYQLLYESEVTETCSSFVIPFNPDRTSVIFFRIFFGGNTRQQASVLSAWACILKGILSRKPLPWYVTSTYLSYKVSDLPYGRPELHLQGSAGLCSTASFERFFWLGESSPSSS